MHHTLSVDLGGTQMRAALLRSDGVVLRRAQRPTPQQDPRPDALIALAREVLGQETAQDAVIGVPGRVDHRQGRLDHAPNLPPAWAPHLNAAALGEALGLPVVLANDADLAALGEAAYGAGRGVKDLVFVTVSTGVGAGVVLNGRLLVGQRSVGEIGHTVIDLQAWRAGRPATVEQLGSGTALARRAAELGLHAAGPEIVALAEAGDARATQALDECVSALCLGVRTLAYLFTPERVVIGGGLGLIGERLLGPVREHLRREGPPALEIEVVNAALGDSAGLIGAAAWRALGPSLQLGA